MTVAVRLAAGGRRRRRIILYLGVGIALGPVAAAVGIAFLVISMFSSATPSSTTTAAGGLNTALIPVQYRAEEVPWILKAGQLCTTLSAPDLAAQLKAESGFNPTAESNTGAMGVAQFEAGTWPHWSQPPAVPGPDIPWVPADAIMAQGRYMCSLAAQAARSGITTASVLDLAYAGYNAGWGAVEYADGIPQNGQTPQYVAEINALIPQFTTNGSPPGGGGSPLGARWVIVQRWLPKQLGIPYVWGGGEGLGPSGSAVAPPDQLGEPGYDCSGLVMVAFAHIGIILPHLAAGQYQQTLSSAVPYSKAAAGDLLFFAGSDGTDSDPGHVAIYMGGGMMIQAPETGQDVDEIPVPTSLLVGGIATVP